jgi:uncharacterized protein YcfL
MSILSRSWTIAAFALAFACTTAPEGSVNRYSGGDVRRGIEIEEGNRRLASALELRNIVSTLQNDIRVIQFDLVSQSSSPLSFQWTIDWYDRAGFKVDYGPQNWTPERLAGKASKTIKIVAPSPAAEGWTLQIGSRDEVR